MGLDVPQHLRQEIAAGRVVLVLGAGASITSHNRAGKNIKLSEPLAAEISHAAALAYDAEELSEVMEAARPIIGDARLKSILEINFLGSNPSRELEALFNFTWRRIYTFNIDDTIRNIHKRSMYQVLKYFNALTDRREDPKGYSECQVIHLHGYVADFSSGFVFSVSDYARQASGRHGWYERLGEDFHDYTVVFIGAKLDEPLLFQHIKSALSVHELAGRSYLITPGPLSPVRAKSLENRDIQHLQATLADFTTSLKATFPSGIRPSEVETPAVAGLLGDTSEYTRKDIDALRNFFPISREALAKRFSNDSRNRRTIKNFYEGYGASWPPILAKAYARLNQFEDVQRQFRSFCKGKDRIFVILGESGSGKSTAAMHLALEEYEASKLPTFEYREQSGTIIEALRSLKKYVRGGECILLLDDLYVYADEVADIISEQQFSFVKIVTSSRLSDWHSRIASQLSTRSSVTVLKRFGDNDVDEIIRKVLENLPVPAFTRLSMDERRARFKKSKKQLLIALKEATESRGFEEIIYDEFSGVQESDARELFYIVGIPTIARSGILQSAAETIYNFTKRKLSFKDALQNHLSGMIDVANSGRLIARHEIYARYVIDKGDFEEILRVLVSILDYFTRFETPVIRHVPKLDGQVFKYILNNKFVYDFFSAHDQIGRAEEFYEEFAVKLQLDGHFWLQYGLSLRRFGKQQDAYDRLLKSVQAYPENPLVHHALAQQKLIAATTRGKYDDVTRTLISEAVGYLLERHFQSSSRHVRPLDEYPLVTLSNYHIDALYRHGRIDDAVKQAKKYFGMIQEMEKVHADEHLSSAKAKLLTFSITRTWQALEYKKGAINFID